MKSATRLLVAAMASGIALSAVAQTPSGAPIPRDRDLVTAKTPDEATARGAKSAAQIAFLVEALRTSLAEARMGELATQQSYDSEVRDYATELKKDHTAHAIEIERLLEPLDVTIPTEPSAAALSQLAALTRLSGEEFDAAFVQMMIWTHTEAIEKYGAQTHANPDRSLHDFATRSLPMLREHLARAESLR
jgi:putative membrane protein